MVSVGLYPLLPNQRKIDSKGPDHHLQKYTMLTVSEIMNKLHLLKMMDKQHLHELEYTEHILP